MDFLAKTFWISIVNCITSFLNLVVSWLIYRIFIVDVESRWSSESPKKTRCVWWISCNLISLGSNLIIMKSQWFLFNFVILTELSFNNFLFILCSGGLYRWTVSMIRRLRTIWINRESGPCRWDRDLATSRVVSRFADRWSRKTQNVSTPWCLLHVKFSTVSCKVLFSGLGYGICHILNNNSHVISPEKAFIQVRNIVSNIGTLWERFCLKNTY